MAAALDQRDAREQIHAALPEPNRRVRSHDPARISPREMDRNAAKGTAPLDHAAIEVRARGADRRYAPEGPHLLDGLIIDEALAVPKNVAGLGLDQQPTLVDPELRGRADPSQVPFVRAQLAVKTFGP